MAKIEIDAAVGDEFICSGQIYQLVEFENGARADGAPSRWARLRTVCPMCGVEFKATSAIVTNGLPRRCSPCVKAGARGKVKPPVHVQPVRRLRPGSTP